MTPRCTVECEIDRRVVEAKNKLGIRHIHYQHSSRCLWIDALEDRPAARIGRFVCGLGPHLQIDSLFLSPSTFILLPYRQSSVSNRPRDDPRLAIKASVYGIRSSDTTQEAQNFTMSPGFRVPQDPCCLYLPILV